MIWYQSFKFKIHFKMLKAGGNWSFFLLKSPPLKYFLLKIGLMWCNRESSTISDMRVQVYEGVFFKDLFRCYIPHFKCREVAFGFPCGLGGAHCPGQTGSVQMWQMSECSDTPPELVQATRTLYWVPGNKLSQMHSKDSPWYTVCQPVKKSLSTFH